MIYPSIPIILFFFFFYFSFSINKWDPNRMSVFHFKKPALNLKAFVCVYVTREGRQRRWDTLLFYTASPPLCVCCERCWFVYRVAWPRWEESSPVSLSFVSDFLPYPCVFFLLFFLLFLSPSLSAPLSVSRFLFGPPTQNSRFNSGGSLWLITLGILPSVWTLPPLQRALPRQSRTNDPGYWLLPAQEPRFTWGDIQFKWADLHNLIFFLWKTINSDASSPYSFFLPLTSPLLTLLLVIVYAQTGKIYCQKNEGCGSFISKWTS